MAPAPFQGVDKPISTYRFPLFDQKTYKIIQPLPDKPYGGSCTGYPQVAPQLLCTSEKARHKYLRALFQLAINSSKRLFYREKSGVLAKLIIF